MIARRLLPSRAATLGALAVIALLHAGRPAAAQSMLGFDPYRPYTSGYESVALPPSASMNFDAINAARAGSYSSRANQMSSFYDELYGPGTGLGGQFDNKRRLMRPGVSYSSADRQYDKDWGRVYTPNKEDTKFYEDKQKRDEEYFKEYKAAVSEKDPKKRRERLRTLELETLSQSKQRARATSALPKTAPALRRPGAVGVGGAAATGARPAARAYSSRLTPGARGTATSPSTSSSAPRPPATRTAPTLTPRTPLPGSATSTTPARSTTTRSRSVPPPASNPGSPPAATRTLRPSEVLDRSLRTEPQPPATGGTSTGTSTGTGTGTSTQPPR